MTERPPDPPMPHYRSCEACRGTGIIGMKHKHAEECQACGALGLLKTEQ